MVRHAGKDATKKYLKKKVGSGWKHKVQPVQSVFQFFAPPQVPDKDLDADEADALEEVRNLTQSAQTCRLMATCE